MRWKKDTLTGMYRLEEANISYFIDPKLIRDHSCDGWIQARGMSLGLTYQEEDWNVTERAEYDIDSGRCVLQTNASRERKLGGIELHKRENVIPSRLTRHSMTFLHTPRLPGKVRTLVERVFTSLH